MHSGLMSVLLLCMASVISAFYVPYYTLQKGELNYAGSAEKRSFLGYGNGRQEKREFNADDLTLRFGKRGDPLEFQPDHLSLRFGR
ncbi:unnamed protein product [Caenorhabditis auriculariae]|uniref:Uncharacterized protein n=1 Tax=Caenorhabditis auriculariae TaxID=2777116 RepID=A0A8S1H1D2_9PELO|nr:unnamed protein product [Caenorhabditis auriculariae]